MIELLRNRIAENAEEFGADCRWVFPSVTAASGHLEEEKLTASEPKLFAETLVAAHAAAFMDHHRRSEGQDLRRHQRALTNHKPKRAKNGDAHAGYIHPDLDDLRASQQPMTDYLLAQIRAEARQGQEARRQRGEIQTASRVIWGSICEAQTNLPIAHSRRYGVVPA